VSDRRDVAAGDTLGRSALREASLTGVRWGSASRLVAEAIAFGASIVLARLIAPAEFGVAIVALGIGAVAPALTWTGFGVPLVRMPTVERAHVEVATLLSVLVTMSLTLVTVVVIAPLGIEPIFGSRVAYLLKLVSPIFALAGISAVPSALLQRDLRFRRLSEIEVASLVAAPLTSISLAATTPLSGEAIVLGGVAAAATLTALTVASAPRVTPRWRRSEARDVTAVGVFAALSAVTTVISRNIHYAILGARLPAQDVGLFWRGYQLAVGYQVKLGFLMSKVAFPLFSRTEDLDALRHLRFRVLQTQSVLLFPLLTTLIVVGPELVTLLYGRRWEGAAFPTQVLAVAGMATIAASAGSGLALAAGKERPLLLFNVIRLAVLTAVVVWSSSYGFRTVAVAIAIHQVVFVGVQFAYLESRHVGIPLRQTWAALVPAAVASAVALSIAYPAVRALAPEVGDGAVVASGGALCVGLYALVVRLGFPSTWSAILRLGVALVRPRATKVVADGVAGSPAQASEGQRG
jgi:PST family polysaccharide transporter